MRVNLTITGTPSGVETIEIRPASGASIYDALSNAAAGTQTTGPKVLLELQPPTITGGTVATDNTYIDVSFSEGVYTNTGGSGASGAGGFRADLCAERGNGDGGGHRESSEDDGWGAHGRGEWGAGESDDYGDAERC